MYTYFIPVFAQGLGASFLDLGLIGAAYSITYAVIPMVAGHLASRFNRVWMFSLSITVIILGTWALTLSRSVLEIAFIRSVTGFAFAFYWPISEVLVIDLAPKERLVREMGLYSVSWGSGYLIGPMVGGLVVQGFGFIWLFTISAILMAFSLLFVFIWIVPSHPRRTIEARTDFSSTLPIMKRLLPWYVIALCYGMISGVIMTVFPGYANALSVDPFLIGILFSAFSTARILTFSVSERLVSFSEARVLHVASGILVAAGLSLAVFPAFQWFLLIMVGVGACFGVLFPVVISFISRHFPNEKVGVATGSYEAVFGLGSAVGPILAGILAQLTSIHWAFVLMSFFAAIMFMAVSLRRRPGCF